MIVDVELGGLICLIRKCCLLHACSWCCTIKYLVNKCVNNVVNINKNNVVGCLYM